MSTNDDEGRGVWRCTFCGHVEKMEREVLCWKCGKGEMVYQPTPHSKPEPGAVELPALTQEEALIYFAGKHTGHAAAVESVKDVVDEIDRQLSWYGTMIQPASWRDFYSGVGRALTGIRDAAIRALDKVEP